MRTLMGLCRAEYVKMRRTILLPMHLLIPLVGGTVFLLYYWFSSRAGVSQVTGYLEVLGVVLPLLVSIICSRSIELEEENHFQTFLGVVTYKYQAFMAKWIVLQLLGIGALILAVGFFAAGYRILVGNVEFLIIHWLIFAGVLWGGSIPLYPFHLYLNLKFSKSVSMCAGIVELLVSALFLTGLGDTVWQYVPCSWSARWIISLAACFQSAADAAGLSGYLQRMSVIGMLLTAAVCGIISVWFLFYEGRQGND